MFNISMVTFASVVAPDDYENIVEPFFTKLTTDRSMRQIFLPLKHTYDECLIFRWSNSLLRWLSVTIEASLNHFA